MQNNVLGEIAFPEPFFNNPEFGIGIFIIPEGLQTGHYF